MRSVGRNRVHSIYGLCFLLVFTLSACTVSYVAQYDAGIVEEIVNVSKKVDMFYGKLLDTSADSREYEKFKETYLEIESDLYALLVRNQIRPLNRESTKQVQLALELWLEDKTGHKKDNTVGDFILKRHREQFTRVFIAIAKGEKARDISSP